jgi:hypothetical protein
MAIFKSNIVVGLSAAVAVTVLAPVLGPVIATIGRPIAKSLLKGGLMLYEKGREAAAVAGESVEDMVAEIKAEDAMQADGAAAHAPPAANADMPADSRRNGRPGMTAV